MIKAQNGKKEKSRAPLKKDEGKGIKDEKIYLPIVTIVRI
jgi:hypothetical protein